ncbi:hypothetical protein NDU88_001649 [Pleurodeles waltl]|uniref:Uncharacterized protein n=1 Tax=Pleurodeles waltl TaxID=8319 RepID=A0AAV7P6E8_PLEWA|nr:hypothetical protein NDU88_001649 [Pleurodeles waltl]
MASRGRPIQTPAPASVVRLAHLGAAGTAPKNPRTPATRSGTGRQQRLTKKAIIGPPHHRWSCPSDVGLTLPFNCGKKWAGTCCCRQGTASCFFGGVLLSGTQDPCGIR